MPITARDYEILRTLVRVQFATTASLQQCFFPDLRGARRRLLTLRAVQGLITTHTKGLPGNYAINGGAYWRLTEAGLQEFIERFPRERVPGNHITRTNRASLRFFEHRDDMTSLYLRLIRSRDKNISDLQTRADAIDWRCEFEVVLKYQTVNGAKYTPREVIPDATLSTPHARFFLEVDRSTESHRYCKRSLAAYASAVEHPDYQTLFPDNMPIVVAYVTKSEARAKGLRQVIASFADLPYRAVALTHAEAGDWLAEAVTSAPGPLTPASLSPDRECNAILRRLYDASRELLPHAPSSDAAAPALLEAYEYLQSLGAH